MSGEIEQDWSRANCKGINTDLFFLEEELLKRRHMDIRHIRQICFTCPIRKECYQYGYSRERWGMFGGVTGWERNEIAQNKLDARFLQALRRDLKEFGVPLEDILADSQIERNLYS
jgi:hypothetical protein